MNALVKEETYNIVYIEEVQWINYDMLAYLAGVRYVNKFSFISSH